MCILHNRCLLSVLPIYFRLRSLTQFLHTFPDDQFYRQMNVRFRALLAFDQLMKHIKRIVRFVRNHLLHRCEHRSAMFRKDIIIKPDDGNILRHTDPLRPENIDRVTRVKI